jgi:hypothetical protein
MLRALARISVIIHFVFLSLLTTPLISGNVESTDSAAFDWRAISFPFNDRIRQAVLFDSANGWASCGSLIDGRLYR